MSVLERCGNKELGIIGGRVYVQTRQKSGRFSWKYFKSESKAREQFTCTSGGLAGLVMTCTETKRVKTNPEGRFGGKEVIRCKKYQPSDLSKCIPTKKPKPKLDGLEGPVMSCEKWEKRGKRWVCRSFLPTCPISKEKKQAKETPKDSQQIAKEAYQEKQAKAWDIFNNQEAFNLTKEQWNMIDDDLKPDNLQTKVTKSTGSEQSSLHEKRLKLRYGAEATFNADLQWYDKVTHKDVIIKAILEGKTVPEHVLNDYPNIEKELNQTVSKIESKQSGIKAWDTSAPFTKDEVGRGNAYKWSDRDYNKEWSELFKDIEDKTTKKLAEYGIKEWPEWLKAENSRYRKAYYDYMLTDFRLGLYYPSPAVVGPSKFPYHRREKFLNRDRKNHETLEAAKKRYWNKASEATKGKIKLNMLNKHFEKALSMDRMTFGKDYAELEAKKAGPNLTGKVWGNVWRKSGRATHERMIAEAVKMNIPVKWDVIKTYKELIPKANIIDRPEEKAKIERPDIVYMDSRKARFLKVDIPVGEGTLKMIEIPEKRARNDVYYLVSVKSEPERQFYLMNGKLIEHELLPHVKMFFGRNPGAKYTSDRYLLIDGDTGRARYKCSGMPSCKEALSLYLHDDRRGPSKWMETVSDSKPIPKPAGTLSKLNQSIIDAFKSLGEPHEGTYDLPQFREV